MIADLPTAHIPILRWSQSPHPLTVWSAVVKVEVSINGEPLVSAGKRDWTAGSLRNQKGGELTDSDL